MSLEGRTEGKYKAGEVILVVSISYEVKEGARRPPNAARMGGELGEVLAWAAHLPPPPARERGDTGKRIWVKADLCPKCAQHHT